MQSKYGPKTAGVSFAKLPSDAKPSTRGVLAQTQMRSLARRFSAANSELRLLARPVHRYQDRKNGILAGAAFTALVQSSSATTGVVIVLASQGLITLPAGPTTFDVTAFGGRSLP